MEAYCNPNIDYTELSQTVKKQKEVLFILIVVCKGTSSEITQHKKII
jgi:hypothetical protein